MDNCYQYHTVLDGVNINVDGSDMKTKIVTLCGSTKFKDDFERTEYRLTKEGIIVLTVGCFAHADGITQSVELKARMDILHMEKIEISDYIYVINKNGYIGESTAREIAYAKGLEKEIMYMEEVT